MVGATLRPSLASIPPNTYTVAATSTATKPPLVQARHLHALLVAANLFWYQAIRQCVGLLVVAMGREFGLSPKEKARLIAAPSVGNIITQALGGLVEAKLGARTTISLAIGGLAMGCTLVPLACGSPPCSNALLLLALQGFIFGPMFPAHSVLLSRWLTPGERGWASAQGELAISLASMGVPLVIASIEASFGWRAGFYATGLGCFAYLGAVLLPLVASRPSECKYLTPEEAELIKTAVAEPKAKEEAYPVGEARKPIDASGSADTVISDTDRMRYGSADTVITKSASFERGEAILFATQAEEQNEAPAPATSNAENSDSPFRVLSHPAILALFITHMVYNLTTLSINSWMPTYYADVLKLPPESAKLHLTLPHLTALLLKLTVSNLATMIRGSGYSMLFSRRIMCAVGFVATALPLVLIPYVSDVSKHSVWATTVLFCLALAGTGFHAEVRACIHASHITHPLDHPPTLTLPSLTHSKRRASVQTTWTSPPSTSASSAASATASRRSPRWSRRSSSARWSSRAAASGGWSGSRRRPRASRRRLSSAASRRSRPSRPPSTRRRRRREDFTVNGEKTVCNIFQCAIQELYTRRNDAPEAPG